MGKPIGETGKPRPRGQNRQQNRPQRGDFTGRKREEQIKEKAGEVAEAQKRTALFNQVREATDEDAVHDPSTTSGGAVVEGGERAAEIADQGLEEIENRGSAEPTDLTGTPQNKQAARADAQPPVFDDELGSQSSQQGTPSHGDQAERLPEGAGAEVEVGGQHSAEVSPVELMASDTVVVRAADDIDQMTVGHGTSYTMEMGLKYRVPRHVAEHMEEKGLVWHN